MAENFSHERILENIAAVKDGIEFGCKVSDRDARGVTLLAATKTVDPETINFAIENGITTIGENRVQELLEKYDAINKDNVDIHFIGRLQTNKVKYIIDKVSMIHSVDSLKLAAEIDRQAKKHGIVMNVLAEINIGHEDSKGGVDPAQTEEFLRGLSTFENIKVKGLMTIPPIEICMNYLWVCRRIMFRQLPRVLPLFVSAGRFSVQDNCALINNLSE